MFGFSKPSTAREHKDRATTLLAKGKSEAALKELQAALGLDAADLAARRKSAEVLAKLGRTREAIAEYQQVAGRLASDGQLIQAIALCKVILQLDPKHTETQDILAGLYARRGEGAGHWTQKIPPSMAGALNTRHLGPAPSAPVEVEIEIHAAALPTVPLFSDLPKEVFLALVEHVAMRVVRAGEPVVREGERGESMYVLADGSVRVVRRLGAPAEQTVARMPAGSFFGEMGLLSDGPRLASVVAEEDCTLLEVTRATLRELEGRFPQLKEIVERFHKERLIANLLRSNPLFERLSADETRQLADRFALENAAPGTVLLREGEPGRGLSVLLRGRCSVFHRDAGGAEKHLPDMAEGALFGEISLLKGTPATATVRAEVPCLLLFLDRASFQSHFMRNAAVAAQVAALGDQRLQRSEALLGEVQERAARLL